MIDVVIPAHDEAAGIAAIVATVRQASSVGRIIVVADACTDDTEAEAQGADLVLRCPAGDKGTAMARGLDHVTTDDVLFVDADLVGLLPGHVEALATTTPAGGQVCGLRDEPWAWAERNLPPITGERRLPTRIARSARLSGSGYRAETLLNAAVGRAHLPHRNVVLVGVTNPTRLVTQPVSWLMMWADLAFLAVLHAPGLAAYVLHPDG